MSAKKRVPMNYYRSGRPGGNSPFTRRPAAKKRRWLAKTTDFLVLLALAAAIAYSLIVKADPQVITSSTVYHPSNTYRQAALSSFQKLQNRNKITFDEQRIINDLKERYPEIVTGRVDLPVFGQTPKMHLRIAEPSFVLNSHGADFIVNSKGVAVKEQRALPNITKLPVVIDQSGLLAREGQKIMAAGEVDFITTLISQCSQRKVPLASITLPPQPLQLDVRTRDADYYVKFYLGGESAVQIGQFLTARQEFKRIKKTPQQYLDVRVPGKIYYK